MNVKDLYLAELASTPEIDRQIADLKTFKDMGETLIERGFYQDEHDITSVWKLVTAIYYKLGRINKLKEDNHLNQDQFTTLQEVLDVSHMLIDDVIEGIKYMGYNNLGK